MITILTNDISWVADMLTHLWLMIFDALVN